MELSVAGRNLFSYEILKSMPVKTLIKIYFTIYFEHIRFFKA